MRVVQIIQGVNNPSAGPTHYVARLADELQRLGDSSLILTIGEVPKDWTYTAPIVAHSKWMERRVGISLALLWKARMQALLPGILHGHGIWRVTNLFPLMLTPDHRAKIVISTHGTLSQWSMRYKSMVKLPFWNLLQKPALARSHCFHVTAPAEYEDLRRVGLRGPVAIVPCGVDLPRLSPETRRMKRVVFMSRIDTVKGLNLLIPAWHSLAGQFPDWELIIAGPLDSDYARSMQRLVLKSSAPRIQFVGQVLGDEKRKLLMSASLFVLPSYSENFGIAVAEALAHGVAVITTTGTPWKDIPARQCGWVVKPTEGELTAALKDGMCLSSRTLDKMGERGRTWMGQDYAWDGVAARMRRTYDWLLSGDRRPDWVICD